MALYAAYSSKVMERYYCAGKTLKTPVFEPQEIILKKFPLAICQLKLTNSKLCVTILLVVRRAEIGNFQLKT